MAAELHVRFERDVLRFLDCLYSTAVFLTSDPGRAERLVQASMTSTFAFFSTLEGSANVKVWLYRDLCRAYDRDHRAGANDRGEPTIGCETAHTSTQQTLPQHTALIRASDKAVNSALRQIPEKLRIVVYLADAQGFTYEEVAEITGLPVATVATRLRRGRRQLRTLLLAHSRR